MREILLFSLLQGTREEEKERNGENFS